MWIVLLALRRPYTFVVGAILVLILGVLTILRMPTDIFPNIDIPVISVIFNYTGMPAQDMERRMVTQFERILTTTVNDIEHIESQSINGIGVIKVSFQPGAKIEAATAQVTAVAQTAIRQMPPGSQPPLIIRYSASNVPIVQLSIGSNSIPEQQLFDLTVNFLRTQLITVPGVQIPYPYGGKQRQVMVDLDPERLFAWGISPSDVSNAVNAQNLILPAGTVKLGPKEYQVALNASPPTVEVLNNLPIKTVNGTTITLGDVAHVRDGFSVQTNVVHVDGKRGILLTLLKAGEASTLKVVSDIRKLLPKVLQTLPPELKVTPLVDQSLFVRASIQGVLKEAAIAAGLTALMILLFLGSWRSTLVVVTSIPLSILVSIMCLSALGQTLNLMTLGGMALAVGILVDDATVEIENIHRNLGQKKRLVKAILDGAQQIAVPAFVSTLSICIVFLPMLFVTGTAKFLFTPLALAVVFAMMTSYLLSRTIVPTMIHFLLASEVEIYGGVPEQDQKHIEENHGVFWRVHERFNQGFERIRLTYASLLKWCLDRTKIVVATMLGGSLCSLVLVPLIGTDFFPSVDAGQIRLHLRAPPGTRIEQSEQLFGGVEAMIRRIIPADELDVILDNIGIPYSGINLSLSDGTMVSPADGEVLVSLKENHRPTAEYIREIRFALAKEFPNLTTFFSPPDIATQVLNFGLPAPIDVQFAGPQANFTKNYELATQLAQDLQKIPGAVDIRLHQVPNAPTIKINVDRTLADQVGVTQRQVASDLLISLSSSNQTAPNFWLNPNSGVNYSVFVQTPQYRMDSLNALSNTPVVPDPALGGDKPQIIGNLAEFERGTAPANITHYNIAPTVDVQLGVQGRDLGSVSSEVKKIVEKMSDKLPRGTTVNIRGQVESMRTSFTGLGWGVIGAALLVYLLMVVNFQSWLDPFIILMALPGAIAGILWMLFSTGTTINVPSLMGAIISVGVATANSILMVSFANEQRPLGANSYEAALRAGMTRLRPVIMTACAMIIGMLPMSLGFGEGGEQNAPLGRAVIGGLSFATVYTLLFVPLVYSALRKNFKQYNLDDELNG